MRVTSPGVRWRIQGDPEVAAQYRGIARVALGKLLARSGSNRSGYWATRVGDATISVRFIDNFDNPSQVIYQVDIDVRPLPEDDVLAVLGPVKEVIQYQFVYTGGAGVKWSVEGADNGLPVAGGSAVGVVFVIRELGVEHASFPLVSTLMEPPPEDPDAWVFVEDLKNNTSQWVDALLVPRFEVVHASSQHLFQPDDDTVVHSPWMPKGKRHYLSQAYTPATIRQSGTLGMTVDDSGSVPVITPTDTPEYGTSSTDIGYESALELYQPPEMGEPYLARVVEGSSNTSAPDSDWYMSYAVQEVEFEGSTKKYGVMVDAAQTLYVWPLDAAGTGSPDSAYSSQLIKTNVDAAYVKSQTLQFPAGVYAESISHRDLFIGFEDTDPFMDGPYKDATRYGWKPSLDGTEFVTIVEKLHDPLTIRNESSGPVSGADDVFFDDERAYRISDPQVATVTVSITPTGPNLEDFTIDVPDVVVNNQPDSFTPVQADYAQEGAFSGVEAGELLVAGFEVRRMEEAVDEWSLVAYLEGEDDFPYGSWIPDPPLFLNFNAIDIAGLPAPLTAVWKYNSGDAGDDGFAHYEYRMPPYMVQDYSFTRVGEFFTDNIAQELVIPFKKSFVLEGRFVVRNSVGTEVFSKCCRKFKENDYEFPNFFTAKVCSLNLPTGSIVFGLCDSETYITSVESRVGRHEDGTGAWGNWYPHTGTNSADKAHAIFHKGRLVDHSSETLVAELDTELSSPVVDKNLSFWGTVRPAATSIIPPAASDQIGFSAGAFNTNYISHLINDLGETAVAVSSGRYGVRGFPWGLEMREWFVCNHFSAESSQEVVSSSSFLAYTGVYIDLEDPIDVQPMSCEVVGTPSVSAKHVDLVYVSGVKYTHAELYEEAFGEVADTAFSVDLQQEKRSPVDLSGNDLGYPYRKTNGASSDPDTWGSELIYAPLVMFYDSGEGVRASNLLMPHVRVYCDIGKSVNPIWFRFPANQVESVEDQGFEDSPFVAKAYAPVETDNGD